jgi:hypothetical protein
MKLQEEEEEEEEVVVMMMMIKFMYSTCNWIFCSL